MTAVQEEVDGRRLRRGQNREAVIDALLELFREGVYEPSSNEIAERAGLSPRSLFRYFEDVDDLHRAATQRQLRKARSLVEAGTHPDDPTALKIHRVVEARVRMFDEIGPAARAARICAHRHEALRAELRSTRAYLRGQLRDLFGPELARTDGSLLPALDVLCSFESYDLLRTAQGLSRPKTVAALTAALGALLAVDAR